MNTGKTPQLTPEFVLLAIVVYIWTIFWKAIALWRASHANQRNWFIALVILSIINLVGIPELIFLFKFCKNKLTISEIKSWLPKK